MTRCLNAICTALSGLNGRGGIVTQGVALGWHVDGPLARNAGPLGRNVGLPKKCNAFITRNAIPPRRGTPMSAWGNAPGIGSTQKPKPQRGDTGFAATIKKNFEELGV